MSRRQKKPLKLECGSTMFPLTVDGEPVLHWVRCSDPRNDYVWIGNGKTPEACFAVVGRSQLLKYLGVVLVGKGQT